MRLYKKGDMVIFCSSKLTVTRDQVNNMVRCKDSAGKNIVLFMPFVKAKKARRRKKKKHQLTAS